MKSASIVSVRLTSIAMLISSLIATGCANTSTAERRPIPLAPVGVVGNGIGMPGGGSADTRATGTTAEGQGQTAIGVTTPASAPLANPGTTTVLPTTTAGDRGPR